MLGHICNPTYVIGIGKRTVSSSLAPSKNMKPYLKNN
jgi:hypothetical protein